MASGDSLYLFDPLSNRPPELNFASVDLRSGFMVLDFDDSVNESAQFLAVLPSHYQGGQIKAYVTWTTTSATTGSAKLQVDVTQLTLGDNLDTLPSVDDSEVLTLPAPTTNGDLVVTQSAALTAGTAVAGNHLLVGVTRLATDVGDTLTGDIELLNVELHEV